MSITIDHGTYVELVRAYELVEKAVRCYGKAVLHGHDPEDEQVRCVVQRLLDEQNAVCWGVDCSHVAKFLDRDYASYAKSESRAVKLLRDLVEALEDCDDLSYEADSVYSEALAFLKEIRHDYEDLANAANVPRPGQEDEEEKSESSGGVESPGASGVGLREEDTLP